MKATNGKKGKRIIRALVALSLCLAVMLSSSSVTWVGGANVLAATPSPSPAPSPTPTPPPQSPPPPTTPGPTPATTGNCILTPTPRPVTPSPVITWYPSNTYFYLYKNSVSGVSPAGENMQRVKQAGATGWQPIKAITTAASYWYSQEELIGSFKSGNWTFTLWTNSPGATSNIRVELYKVNRDGTGATLLGTSPVIDVNTSGTGNHETQFIFSNVKQVDLSFQRIMIKIVKVSGTDAIMCYNTNDFPTRLVTP